MIVFPWNVSRVQEKIYQIPRCGSYPIPATELTGIKIKQILLGCQKNSLIRVGQNKINTHAFLVCYANWGKLFSYVYIFEYCI